MNIDNMGKALKETMENLMVNEKEKNVLAKKIVNEVIDGLREKISKEEILIKSATKTHTILYEKLGLNPQTSKLACNDISKKAENKLYEALMNYIVAISGEVGYQRMRGEVNE